MDRTERFYKIDKMLQARKLVPIKDFLDELDVSLATFKRDLEYMRDRLNAPIVWDRDQNGYRFEWPDEGAKAPRYELPGLWFSADEAESLLTLERLVETLEPSLLGPHLQPLKTRLTALLSTGNRHADEVRKRIRVMTMGARKHEPKYFSIAATSVLNRRRLRLDYLDRIKNVTTSREISPQRLVYYRMNWYIDAWCHLRNGLRIFAVDAIQSAELTDTKAKDVADQEIKEEMTAGYGIFSGKNTRWATLRFNPERARYVSLEQWHSKQRSRWEKDGSYVLEIPYSSDKELAMDILRYGAEVEVVAPDELRKEIRSRLKEAIERY
jgi:predicted DNA-binding transcriptional regulator YafY